MEVIKIIQHNVIKWTLDRRNELFNYYTKEDPDIILLNSTGIPDNQNIKIFTYKVYQRNFQNEEHAGVAIAIKYNVKHKILDNFQEDFIGIEIDTNRGPIIVTTTYLPPRRNYIH